MPRKHNSVSFQSTTTFAQIIFRPSMLRLFALLLSASALLILPPGALAAGPEEAITIEADQMQYNNKRQSNVFSGNVVLIRGGFEIRAERLEIRQDAAGNQLATASGSPATFKRKQPGKAGTVEGSGSELRYSDKTQELQIIKGATLRRVTRGKISDEVHGAKIVYQGSKDYFTVVGGKQGRSNANPRGRVRVVIQPRSRTKPKGDPAKLRPSRSVAQ